MKYIITVPEVWNVEYPVEASNEREAYDKIAEMIRGGNLPEVDSFAREFSHIMTNASWDIRKMSQIDEAADGIVQSRRG